MKSFTLSIFTVLVASLFSWLPLSLAQTKGSTPDTSVTPSSAASEMGSASKQTSVSTANLVFIVRHAIAPGTGDPSGFRLGDCSTQRNLSHEGIVQAQDLGKRLKALGILPSMIWSSQWCRASDTAKNLGLGPVAPLPALNSFFANPDKGPPQMRELERILANLDPSKGPYVMVTHQVVITTLTGVFPGSGEGVWLKLTGEKNKPWTIHQP